jgi:hypothetical protein
MPGKHCSICWWALPHREIALSIDSLRFRGACPSLHEQELTAGDSYEVVFSCCKILLSTIMSLIMKGESDNARPNVELSAHCYPFLSGS